MSTHMNRFSVIVPDGPQFTVHKGWKVPRKPHRDAIPPLPFSPNSNEKGEHSSSTRGQYFEFVNSVKPGQNKDPELKKLVRTHVRNEQVRNSHRLIRNSPKKLVPQITNHADHHDSDNIIYWPPHTTTPSASSSHTRSQAANPSVPRDIGYQTALINFDFPIEMNTSIHRVLDHYFSHIPLMVYPLESCLRSNPLKSPEWFQYAIEDSAMLHSVLYAGSLYLALLEGKKESKDTLYHLSRVVSIVNQRLNESGGEIEDSTIGAISCLALGEVKILCASLKSS